MTSVLDSEGLTVSGVSKPRVRLAGIGQDITVTVSGGFLTTEVLGTPARVISGSCVFGLDVGGISKSAFLQAGIGYVGSTVGSMFFPVPFIGTPIVVATHMDSVSPVRVYGVSPYSFYWVGSQAGYAAWLAVMRP